MNLKVIIYILFLCFTFSGAYAQNPVSINDQIDQHKFTFKEIEYLEDTSGKLTIGQVSSPASDHLFKTSISSTLQIRNLNTVYWYRIKIKPGITSKKDWVIEFFDQTIDQLTCYLPDGHGTYLVKHLGDNQPFDQRDFKHKNFELSLKPGTATQTFYFKIQSHETANIIIVLRSVNRLLAYANDEYFAYGLLYGMILIFAFYNILMFLAVKRKQYLYYVLYILSVGLYQMSADGIAYQYLWPSFPVWNQYAYAVALCAVSVFCLLFTMKLMHTKQQAPLINKIITGTIILRLAFFFYCLLFNRELFSYKFIDFIPLLLAYGTGFYFNHKGYRPARFFIIGYSCLCLGFLYKIFIIPHFDWLNTNIFTCYSLSISFISEMIFLSLAISDHVRILKRKKDKAKSLMIAQMKKNEELQLRLNQELETLVAIRTQEVNEKAAIVEEQNLELMHVNELLIKQAEEISRINTLLEKDNKELHINVTEVTLSRVMSKDVDFEEFGRIYPDNISCYTFLADLKWKEGYHCRRCGHDHSFGGRTPFSRRCTKCDYDESVTAYTIFQNSRIPINKAFYLLFLMYSSKGKISSHKLAEALEIRQGTCWSYSIKIKKLMDERKKELKQNAREGWSKLVLEQ
jgi:hypothetical protein